MSNVFSVGDFVRTLKFVDGSSHSFDSVHLITEDTLAYYNNPCNSKNYKKVEPQKNGQRQIYLSEITELASVFLDPSTEELSSVTSTILDLGSIYQIPWPCAQVFSYKGENFLVREYEADGEVGFCNERTKVVNDKVWLEVIELILEQVRKETLNKLLTYI